MATVTFDTLRLVEKLKTAGISQFDSKLEKELAPLRTDLAVIKWMMGVLLASVLSLVLKTFF